MSNGITKKVEYTVQEYIEDLFVEFDEVSFYPATLMPNAEECARVWKGKLIYAIEQLRKETAKEITSKVVDLNISCGDDFRLFLYSFELWVKERYGVEVE